MVVIKKVKYACESCIRGHRASKCNHFDRPLMPVKKPGRPSTTCSHCKILRQEKNINPSGSCNCAVIEKDARFLEFDENILDRCFCYLDQDCKCHTRRKKLSTSTDHKVRRVRDTRNSEVEQLDLHALERQIVPSPPNIKHINPSNQTKSDIQSCCAPSLTDVKTALNDGQLLLENDSKTRLDHLIPSCCSSSQISSQYNNPTVTKQGSCCDPTAPQHKEVDIAHLLDDTSLTDLTILNTLTNDFIDGTPY